MGHCGILETREMGEDKEEAGSKGKKKARVALKGTVE